MQTFIMPGWIRSWTVIAVLVGCLAIAPILARAQQESSPEQLRATMLVMFKTMIDVYSSPEMAGSMASFYWNFYQALIEKGFSKEQALAITRAQTLVTSRAQ